MKILLVGGPKHGEEMDMPTTPLKFEEPVTNDMLVKEMTFTYTICQTGDGVYYGVYEPMGDPSVMRMEALRNTIRKTTRRYE